MVKIKCGLEIHQQLDCKKLFCECPSIIKDGTAHFTVKRRLRAVVGETGHVDVAAAQEAMKGKMYVYEGFDDNTCLIDLDEEPPRGLRSEALNAALLMGKMTKAKFVDEVQVMRKTVVDGSNTSGFQRTALVAYDGVIESSKGPISIPTVIVEEDSARRIKDEQDSTTFRLDRLGIPLLEVSTGPDIVSPQHAVEVAEALGLLLRSTGLVKRGLGTIRQDLNVSIVGGTRVEIKGAQDLKLLPKLAEWEGNRQEKLLEIKHELAKRKVKKPAGKIMDVSHLLKNSKSKIVKATISKGGVVLGVRLSCFKGIIGKEVQPGKRLGTEFSECAKVAAGVGGIFHSDELPNSGILPDQVERIAKHLDCGSHDGFVMVAVFRERAERALNAVIQRAEYAVKGVPGEVRAANPDGTTRFLRPMPGAARMYPATDALPIRVTKKMIADIKIPELIDSKIKRYVKLGMGRDLAKLAAKSVKAALFDDAVKKFKKLKPAYIAETLLSAERSILTQYKMEVRISEERYYEVFTAIEKGALPKESVLEVLKEKGPVKDVLKQFKSLSDADIKKVIEKIMKKNKGAPMNALMGQAMAQLKGKASGQKVMEIIKKLSK